MLSVAALLGVEIPRLFSVSCEGVSLSTWRGNSLLSGSRDFDETYSREYKVLE